MTGMFELFTGSDSRYRFRLTAPDGTVMALSRPFPDKPSAVAGIAAVREYAGMGLVTEITAPEDAAVQQPVAVQVFRGPAHGIELLTRDAADGVSEAPVRLPRFRIPSAAHFLDGRAVARNHEMIMRWRQPRVQEHPAGLGPC